MGGRRGRGGGGRRRGIKRDLALLALLALALVLALFPKLLLAILSFDMNRDD